MNTFKNKIINDIVNPAESSRGKAIIVGQVTKSDENNNYCSVKFVDKDGMQSNKNNVSVRVYNSGIIDWFPKVGELVNIEESNGTYQIVSKLEYGYGSGTRSSTELTNDILPESMNSNTGGYIF